MRSAPFWWLTAVGGSPWQRQPSWFRAARPQWELHDSGTVLWCGAELSREEREEDFDLCSFSRTINSGGVVNTACGYGEPVANRNQGCGGDASCSWRVSAETAAQPESSLSAD